MTKPSFNVYLLERELTKMPSMSEDGFIIQYKMTVIKKRADDCGDYVLFA